MKSSEFIEAGANALAIITGGEVVIEVLIISYKYSLPNHLYFSMIPLGNRIAALVIGFFLMYGGARRILQKSDGYLYYSMALAAVLSFIICQGVLTPQGFSNNNRMVAGVIMCLPLLMLVIIQAAKFGHHQTWQIKTVVIIGIAVGGLTA